MAAFSAEAYDRNRPVADIKGLAEDRSMKLGFTCPVCGFHNDKLPPFEDGQNKWFQEICPSCGTQFGYDDDALSHHALRLRWVEGGAKADRLRAGSHLANSHGLWMNKHPLGRQSALRRHIATRQRSVGYGVYARR